MIPNKIKNQNVDAIISFVNKSQTDKLRSRKQYNKYIQVYKKGTCCLCKREGVTIINQKYSLCAACFKWCKYWIIKKCKRYSPTLLVEAMIAFQEPVLCRFYDRCGNTFSRTNEEGLIKVSDICKKCWPIFNAGFKSGRSRRDRRRKGIYVNTEEQGC